ncbi:hypothetical protein [Bradyrhizobium roseum]|uniref:hypothetical protein n=1 Tax=Bradyrhizobium roseum TaxID=3056648 RepID=UPI0026237128|nr:hypothetical protein [Bradyrhizobium roseus]WKA30648.1 hypothetical protein QUH67_10965 [Bradyrhizobium roseus]
MWKAVFLLCASIPSTPAHAEERGRIRRPPPSQAEAERLASEMALNDGLLERGDIVVTDRGFFVFRGLAPDGSTGEFTQVPNPVIPTKPAR